MFVYWALQGDKERGKGLPGKLFAVEPLQQNRRVMEHNLKRHDLLAKVIYKCYKVTKSTILTMPSQTFAWVPSSCHTALAQAHACDRHQNQPSCQLSCSVMRSNMCVYARTFAYSCTFAATCCAHEFCLANQTLRLPQALRVKQGWN
jgi:hypothetical protein